MTKYTPKRAKQKVQEHQTRGQQRELQLRTAAVFFLLPIPILELLLRLASGLSGFFSFGLIRSVFAGAALGALLWLISALIPNKRVSRVVTGVLYLLVAAIFIIECCVRSFFGSYYQLAFLLNMSGDVAGDFMGKVVTVLLKNIWFFALALAPLYFYIRFARVLVPEPEQGRRDRSVSRTAMLFVVLQVVALLLCHVGSDTSYATVDYSANSTTPRFGLVNMLRLEAKYAVFGQPIHTGDLEDEEPDDPVQSDPPAQSDAPAESSTVSSEVTGEASSSQTVPEQPPVVYTPNVTDIDFDALKEKDAKNEKLLAMDKYFSGQTPTMKNEYTGLFKGKNLVMLTAEGFSPYAIDKERTPALYRLANTAFVFPNYYQPDWSQSTTGGEYAHMTGLIPTWVKGKTSFKASINDDMPYGLGWMFGKAGYTTKAYHNNTYSYYGRSETHPNLGYDYKGIGNGLELPNMSGWPLSDLEMLQATIDTDIQHYLDTGTPFHTYYMTVSGHFDYSWSLNKMSKKNRGITEGMSGSETVLAYYACQMELEYAMEYLLQQLEAANILDDTVIVMTADHYPYGMLEDGTDHYNEMTGNNDSEKETSRFRNTLILWSGCIKEPIVIEDPCSAIDVVPTLFNLFGMEYDSRLLSGRDLLAPDVEIGEVDSNMHVVPFVDNGFGVCWITRAGRYESNEKKFYPNPGVELEDEADYCKRVNRIVQNRELYAKYLIEYNYYKHVMPDWKS